MVLRRQKMIWLRKTPLWDEPVEEMSRVKHSESLLHGCLLSNTPCHREGVFTLVIARAKPVAIHCEQVSEETSRTHTLETGWIAASITSFTPRNDKVCLLSWNRTLHSNTLVIARAKPVAIHCDPVSEPYCPYVPIAYSGLPRQSLRSLLAMTRSVLSSRGRSPWRSTVIQ